MSAARNLEDPISSLVAIVVKRTLAELGIVGAVRPPEEYSSLAPAEGVNRRAHNRRCKSGKVKGAQKEGNIWRCSRAAWHASFAPVLDPEEDAYRAGLRR